ncbi:MAG: hypothetical protein P4L36_20765 [Holophaga sp.]|nr:hypothetical protein [Holophaga sp.]
MSHTFVSDSPLRPPAQPAAGSIVEIAGEPFYHLVNYDTMPPFLMSLVSDSDHWLFISSNGALTAGRKDPDHALFPYCTDDRIHDSQDQTGAKTLLRVRRRGRTSLWEPFSQRYDGLYRVVRSLYKSVYGNKILFEERNQDLGLRFRYGWLNSERFGFVRQSALHNEGADPVSVDLVDGFQNVLPFGVERRFQAEYSTLADGYKRTERVPGTSLALFRLSSIPVDKAEPSEALRVNLAWSAGLEPARRLLSTAQLEAFRMGAPLQEESDVRGQRGAYLLNATVDLRPGTRKDWLIVAELGQDAVGVRALARLLDTAPDPAGLVLEDVARCTRNLVQLVAGADGLQATADPLSTWRHFSDALFNIMRGGIPDDGYRISRDDLASFLAKANARVAGRHAAFLAALPESLPHGELLDLAARQQDPDLERLANEYLPLTFSRRHGDPSRPWNTFSIQLKDERGGKILNFEGNWRDLFQNWEALGCSYPGFIESMIFKFADSSTADGYNPYRVMREGFEWEVIDPRDPWSFIGYWGDHQVIYLLKLLEASRRYHPSALAGLLGRRLFTFANIPYRIKPYQEMLANPRSTITFEQVEHDRAMALAAELGSDGKALMAGGEPVRANLAEKLLLVALTKLSNFVPEAGIWMNTQRPEWNDANNALVGYGVSMVTLYYLRRYLAFCLELFQAPEATEIEAAEEIAELLEAVAEVFREVAPAPGRPVTPRERKQVLDALGQAGTRYRARIYQDGFSGRRVRLTAARIQAFCASALAQLDHSIRVNRRGDGLYHAYNLMKVAGDRVEVRHLCEMLEGQVAALSSGALSGADAVVLLDALRASALYRADQNSYILYPDNPLPHFLEQNNIPEGAAAGSPLLRALLERGDQRIVVQDVDGQTHFNAAFRNDECLKAALEDLRGTEFGPLAEQEGPRLLELYERVFDHQSFTGRSGTFYKYEGLGCIYWHMVAKLLVAVDEVRQAAAGGEPGTLARLQRHYHEIREGLGVHKSPALHGAIPIDPYSHTPGFAGAQQPGMTGQVKEDILTRISEMGVKVSGGRITFQPWIMPLEEFLAKADTFRYVDLDGQFQTLQLAAGTLAFTLCQVPVVAHRGGAPRIIVTRGDGRQVIGGLALDAATSGAIHERTGAVRQLEVFLGLDG